VLAGTAKSEAILVGAVKETVVGAAHGVVVVPVRVAVVIQHTGALVGPATTECGGVRRAVTSMGASPHLAVDVVSVQ
jgi:hypothetical protein